MRSDTEVRECVELHNAFVILTRLRLATTLGTENCHDLIHWLTCPATDQPRRENGDRNAQQP